MVDPKSVSESDNRKKSILIHQTPENKRKNSSKSSPKHVSFDGTEDWKFEESAGTKNAEALQTALHKSNTPESKGTDPHQMFEPLKRGNSEELLEGSIDIKSSKKSEVLEGSISIKSSKKADSRGSQNLVD